MILYELNKINKRISLSDPRSNNILSEFIHKAKQKYQIKKIGVSGESADFFVKIINVYNNSRQKPTEKFDIYNLEYEYWSSKASGIDGYYCVNYLEENGKLFLVSDNELYKPYEVKGEDVLEIWEAKAFISTDFPNPGDKKKPLTLDDLGEMIRDIQADLKQIRG